MEGKDIIETSGGDHLISRKEAIKKAGKYAAFTAAAMMLILEGTAGPQGPPTKSEPKPPRPGQKTKSAQKPRTDPPPIY